MKAKAQRRWDALMASRMVTVDVEMPDGMVHRHLVTEKEYEALCRKYPQQKEGETCD